MKKEIQILLNGLKETVTEGETVLSLIKRFNEQDKSLIVEVNGQFVYQLDYSKVTVSAGDEVEFINPNFGG